MKKILVGLLLIGVCGLAYGAGGDVERAPAIRKTTGGYTMGNVGIGTTDTSAAKLSVVSNGNDTATLGTELVTNGTFNDATGWTLSANWSVSGGKLVCAAGAVTTATCNIDVINGTTYVVTFNESNDTAGKIAFTYGSVVGFDRNYYDQTSDTFTANTTGTVTLTITPSATYDGSLDNISIKPLITNVVNVLSVKNSDLSAGVEIRSGGIGLNNSFIGYQAGYSNTTGNNNSFIGQAAGRSNTTGNNNSFIGQAAGYSNTTGGGNSFIGYQAGRSNTTGNNNSFIGQAAGRSNTTGNNNSFIGQAAGYSNTTGNNNSFIGYYAGRSNTTGNNNSFIGQAAGYSNTTGNNNSFIGYYAGRYIADGSTLLTDVNNSIFIGAFSRALSDITTNEMVIGDTTTGLGSNTCILGNSSITKTQLQGNIGIGTSAPSYNLAFAGQSAKTQGMERHTTDNTAGNAFTLSAGGATSGATDKDGGMLTFAPGLSTGTGKSSIRLQGLTRANSTGTTDNTLVDRMIVPSRKYLTDNSVVGVFEVAVANNSSVGGSFTYAIHATDGTEYQMHTGMCVFGAVSKAAAITADIGHSSGVGGLELDVGSSGTLTDTWSVVESDAGKITISINADSSLTTPVIWMDYILDNNCAQAVTQL